MSRHRRVCWLVDCNMLVAALTSCRPMQVSLRYRNRLTRKTYTKAQHRHCVARRQLHGRINCEPGHVAQHLNELMMVVRSACLILSRISSWTLTSRHRILAEIIGAVQEDGLIPTFVRLGLEAEDLGVSQGRISAMGSLARMGFGSRHVTSRC